LRRGVLEGETGHALSSCSISSTISCAEDLRLADDEPVGDEQDAVGDRCGPCLVRHHNDPSVRAPHRAVEDLENLPARFRVEVAVGSSAKTIVGLLTSGGRWPHAVLAAGELRRAVVRRLVTHAIDQLVDQSRSGFTPAMESGSRMFSLAVSIAAR